MSPQPPGGDPPDTLARDETIPVLTDVVKLAPPPPPVRALPPLADEDWAALAARVETGVTERLLSSAGPLLDEALARMLGNLFERATAQLALDLRDVYAHLVRDLVARTVADEVAALRAREDPAAPV